MTSDFSVIFMQKDNSFNDSKISDLEFQVRIRRVNVLCDALYDNCTRCWSENLPFISDLLVGKDIVEIGCGPNGGLSKSVLDCGINSYMGIDIDKSFIAQSKRLFPDVNFIWDDPVYTLKNINHPVTCISSGVIDSSILRDRTYAEILIKAMSEAASIGGHSIHQAFMIVKDYNSLFEKYNFKSINRGLYQSYSSRFGIKFEGNFGVYERVR
jgi:hypothetical protein